MTLLERDRCLAILSEVTLPNFLVIGAYKSGTTSIFEELRLHPEVFVPAAKEIAYFIWPNAMTQEALAQYCDYFKTAGGKRAIGEVAPQYTGLPVYSGAPERVSTVLGLNVRLIYFVRHPIDRMLSHYRHLATNNQTYKSVDQAIADVPQLVAVSQYSMQLAPWIQRFGRDNVLVIRFEDYVMDPAHVRETLFGFLHVDPNAAAQRDADLVVNRSAERRIKPAWIGRLLRTHFYRRVIKEMVSPSWRGGVSRLLFPVASRKGTLDPVIADDVYARLQEKFREDQRSLCRLLDRTEPFWPDLV